MDQGKWATYIYAKLLAKINKTLWAKEMLICRGFLVSGGLLGGKPKIGDCYMICGMILVVGATGQLGACIVGKLADQGKSVRAFARESSDHAFLRSEGVEIAFGDLRDRASLFDACKDVETLIATANTAIPRKKGDSFEALSKPQARTGSSTSFIRLPCRLQASTAFQLVGRNG
jgi:hypothetical protein